MDWNMLGQMLICFFTFLTTVSDCLERCSYTFKNNYTIADCKFKSLDKLPRKIYNVHRMELSHNNFGVLHKDMFLSYKELDLLLLDNCNIQKIYPGAFRGLDMLSALDCSQNSIDMLTKHLFKDIKQIRIINLFKNKLKRIESDLFKDLEKLELVDLSSNHIVYVAFNSFGNNPKLSKIYLNDNSLKKLSPFQKVPLLQEINLQKNILICNYELKSFCNWIANPDKPIKTYAVCHKPDYLNGVPLADMSSNDVSNCSLQMINMTSDFYYESGIKFANISCNLDINNSSHSQVLLFFDNSSTVPLNNKKSSFQWGQTVNSSVLQAFIEINLDNISKHNKIICQANNGKYCKNSEHLLVEEMLTNAEIYFSNIKPNTEFTINELTEHTESTYMSELIRTTEVTEDNRIVNTSEMEIEEVYKPTDSEASSSFNFMWIILIVLVCGAMLIVSVLTVVYLKRKKRNMSIKSENSIVFQQPNKSSEFEEETNAIYGLNENFFYFSKP